MPDMTKKNFDEYYVRFKEFEDLEQVEENENFHLKKQWAQK